MSGGSRRRIELAAAYVLHHRPWRDSSRILEVLARDHGRITLFARGVRGSRSRSSSLLQPFQCLLLSWSGTGEAARLTQVDLPDDSATEGFVARAPMPASALLSAWYLNELLLALTVRNDPQPALFELYDHALAELSCQGVPAMVLRRFERQLLEHLGYGIDFSVDARSGERVRDGAHYHFHASLGFVEVAADERGSTIPGSSLRAIATGDFAAGRALDDARRIMRTAIDHVLEGRELRTRAVAQSIARNAGQRSRGSAAS